MWERFKLWAVDGPSTPVGRWIADHVSIDEQRLEGRFHTFNTDPLWLPEDRAVVEIWQLEQAQKCPTCNTFDWEFEEDPEAWTAGIHWCLGCKSIEELREQTAATALHPEGYKLRLYRGKDEHDGSDT